MIKLKHLKQYLLSSFTLWVEPPSGAAAALTTEATTTTTTTTPTDKPTIPADAWYKDFKDQGVKDWLHSYGEAYPNPEAVAMKALNLEKFVGLEKAGRGVILPKPEASDQEWTDFFKKVGGTPEKPDGYTMPKEIKDVPPELLQAVAKDPMVQRFRESAHAMGLPPRMFQQVMGWYVAEAAKTDAAKYAEFESASEADMETLRSEWKGIEYDKNVELGRRAAKMFIPHANPEELAATITKIEGALGTAATMRLFAKIGVGLSEHVAVMGEGTGGGASVLTVEGAKVRIDTLKKDKDFQDKLLKGGTDQKNEWNMLHTIAFGTKAT